MKSSPVLASLSVLFSLSFAACGSSTSQQDDAGGHGAMDAGATSTGAGGNDPAPTVDELLTVK